MRNFSKILFLSLILSGCNNQSSDASQLTSHNQAVPKTEVINLSTKIDYKAFREIMAKASIQPVSKIAHQVCNTNEKTVGDRGSFC